MRFRGLETSAVGVCGLNSSIRKRVCKCPRLGSRISPNGSDGSPTTILEIDMPNQQERRDSERVPCRRTYPYELANFVDSSTVEFSEEHGHSINCSGSGMLLLLPEQVDQRKVFEIQVPSEARKEQITKLMEVCWTRLIPVRGCVTMYIVGTRFLFELPVPS